MSELHEALALLHPRDFGEVPTADLQPFLTQLFSKCELIANSVPPPPGGTLYESAQRTRTDSNGATCLEELTVSEVRRPSVPADYEELQKSWGKPVKLSKQDAALGISVYKMAGHDRHGAWFARSSVHEGLGFEKWKRAMMREFPESLEVQGGPGEGNVRGIGGDRRIEEIEVPGVGRLEVLQLSAQFPGPTSPREFITMLSTSDRALSEASKVGETIPRHYMVVSIPVTHPDAPERDGMVRGQYESVEMIREIPLSRTTTAHTSSSDLPQPLDGTSHAPGQSSSGEDPETNPVEWLMITRSDPGGGIPRFMVERSTPSSIVQDAGKFLQWACSKDHFPPAPNEQPVEDVARKSIESERAFSVAEGKGVLAGVGTSIADDPRPVSFRRPSQRQVDTHEHEQGFVHTIAEAVESYLPQALNPLHRTASEHSISSSSSSSSSTSFASAEQFNTANEGDSLNEVPSSPSEASLPLSTSPSDPLHQVQTRHMRELEKIEARRQQAITKISQQREKASRDTEEANIKAQKELEKAQERHERERKKQQEKYAREMRKLEEKREKETRKLLAKQKKEAEKNEILKLQKERDEWKKRAEFAEEENRLLQEQVAKLQRETTVLVAEMGKTEEGISVVNRVKEELEGNGKGRRRASSVASESSRSRAGSHRSGRNGNGEKGIGHSNLAPPDE